MTDDVKRVKEAVSIVDVIGQFVDLKKSGKNYKGLCPFHKEKTPSFVVSEERGTYKCFGCGEYGDVFSFLMKRDNMTFPEALDYLADKGGIVLENTRQNRREKIDFEKYYKINDDARKFFYQNLLTSKLARGYLRDRGIEDYTINEFSLGYAPDSWDSLLNYMLKQGHKVQDLVELGLVGQGKKGNYYDIYRNRLIFPIFNIRNKITGFGGRTLGEDRAKYINSPDSKVYHKGKELYGLNLIHNGNDRDKIILVEGYMDVIGLRQAGFKNTLAGLGTALTEDQAKLCNRYAKQIYLCYDSDRAGIEASLRAIETFRSIGVYPKIIRLDEGMDPDDYVKEFGNQAFERKIKEAENYIDYQIDLVLSESNIEDPSNMRLTMEKLSQIIGPIKSEIMKDDYIDKVSKKLDVNPMSLASDLGKFNYQAKNLGQRPRKKESTALPASLLLLVKFVISSKEYYHEFKDYLSYLDDYGLSYISSYIVDEYDNNGKIDLSKMKGELGLNDRQESLLSLDGLKDEEIAYKELKHRINRFKLEREKVRLKDEISMIISIVDSNPEKEDELRAMLDRLSKIEVELKTDSGWGE